MSTWELLLRVALGFLVLFTLTRIMGRKEISQMTFFNFVSAIAIGSIAANLVVNQNLSILNGVLSLVGWTIFTLVMDFIDIKSKRARKVVSGTPTVVIKEGKIVESAMRQSRLDLDSLTALLRQKSIFSMTDVEYAVFETNGNISVLKKEEKQPLTKKDLNIPIAQKKMVSLETAVISDGHVLSDNLSKMNLDQTWLEQQLQQAGIQSPAEVFYAEVQKDGTLFIDTKENLLH